VQLGVEVGRGGEERLVAVLPDPMRADISTTRAGTLEWDWHTPCRVVRRIEPDDLLGQLQYARAHLALLDDPAEVIRRILVFPYTIPSAERASMTGQKMRWRQFSGSCADKTRGTRSRTIVLVKDRGQGADPVVLRNGRDVCPLWPVGEQRCSGHF
jgi:hypothetical protein